MDTTDRSLARLGGFCAILLGLISAAGSALYVILPADLQASVPAPRFLPAFAKDSMVLVAIFWSQAAVGILGLAVVPAVTRVVAEVHQGWSRWMSNLAIVGFAVSSVGYFLSLERLPRIAAAYVAGDLSTQAALAAVWKSSIDLFGVWGYGAVGAWVFVISVLAFRASRFTVPLNIVGLAAGVVYFMVPVATIFKVQALISLAAVVGVPIGLVWYLWVGYRLLRD